MTHRMLAILGMTLALALAAPSIADDKAEKRAKADSMAEQTLGKLFADNTHAKTLYDKAYGYAVFDVKKVSLGITGGGGTGVAVNKESGKRTYMNMGFGGLNIGLGGNIYQTVFLFQDEGTFNKFVDVGWDAQASADAVAARSAAQVEANFIKGVAFYQLTEAGLMLQADISGTKYWKSKLNNDDQLEKE
ncbi:MAG: hypothetical protein V3U59_00135 [Gammaproteobacteria bacterium]